MRLKGNTSPRWRTIAVLAIGIAIGTTMMATPAGAHVYAGGTTALNHLVGHMKKYFFTKSQSDARYVNVGESEGWREVGATGQPAFITQTCFDPGPFDYFPKTWTNFGAGHNSLAFYKDALGRVHLKGLIKDGWTFDDGNDISGVTSCGQIFQLPAGYRPAVREVYATITYDSSGIRTARVNIDGDGLVWAAEDANRAWLSLDGISFRAAN
jgi:hypothetical protein